jgi:ferredoxin
MAKYQIEHDRPNCIGCAACAAVAPDFWEMNDDGKSDIKKSRARDDGWQEADIGESDFQANKEAADACPVNVIHITDKDSGKRLI